LTIGFDIRCELEYTLEGQSEFLFNVHAAENSHQTIVTESFGLDGALSYTQYTNAETGNRFVRAMTRTDQASTQTRSLGGLSAFSSERRSPVS
jgi:hypothetical protein